MRFFRAVPLRSGILLIAATIAILADCSRRQPAITRSFYSWKTRLSLSDSDRAFLSRLAVTRLYIRFFDVEWDETALHGVPIAVIEADSGTTGPLSVVPVVYVTNKTLLRTADTGIPSLGENIVHQVGRLAHDAGMAFDEIQIDCDWTLRTRESYFSLLESIRSHLGTGARLSVTIRLHQAVHSDRTGVPPADRGMLMFYNMGKKSMDEKENSIYSAHAAKPYLDRFHGYPLPLDIVLPLYGWILHFRGDRLIDLMQGTREGDLRTAGIFTRIAPNLYRADGSFVFRGGYVMKGDIMKIESVDADACTDAARILADAVGRTDRAVAIFSYDSPTITGEAPDALESIFRSF